jgi:hypothetical protein
VILLAGCGQNGKSELGAGSAGIENIFQVLGSEPASTELQALTSGLQVEKPIDTGNTENGGLIVVIPEAPVPPGFSPVPHAIIRFMDGTSITADENGKFDLSSVSKEIRDAALNNANQQPIIIAEAPTGSSFAGAKPAVAQIPIVLTEASAGSIVSLKIIPHSRLMFTEQRELFFAVGIDTNGEVVRPTDVTWSIVSGDPNPGDLTPISGRPNVAVYSPSPGVRGRVLIQASVSSGILGNPATSDTAVVHVVDGSQAPTLSGVLKDMEGRLLTHTQILFFNGSPLGSLPLITRTDHTGFYSIQVFPNFSYGVAINQTEARSFFLGDPGFVQVSTEPASIDLALTDTPFIFRPLPPIDFLIAMDLFSLNAAVSHPLPDPESGIEQVVGDAPVGDSSGVITSGTFINWVYTLTKGSDGSYDMDLTSPDNHFRIHHAFDNTRYTFTRDFNILNIIDPNNAPLTFKVQEGYWTETGDHETQVEGQIAHFDVAQQDQPLLITKFRLNIHGDGSTTRTISRFQPNGITKISDFTITRSAPSPADPRFTFTDGVLVLFDRIRTFTLAGTLNSDGSGAFTLTNTTFNDPNKGAQVITNLNVLPPGGTPSPFEIAHGSVTIPDPDHPDEPITLATFTVDDKRFVTVITDPGSPDEAISVFSLF